MTKSWYTFAGPTLRYPWFDPRVSKHKVEIDGGVGTQSLQRSRNYAERTFCYWNKAKLTVSSYFILISVQLVECFLGLSILQSTFQKVPGKDNIPMLTGSLKEDAK
jgi:hypothetical protein